MEDYPQKLNTRQVFMSNLMSYYLLLDMSKDLGKNDGQPR